MTARGYYRYPTIHDDRIAFVSEDDLWTVPLGGGPARRLTAGVGEASHAQFSPDGKWLAFSGTEEGVREVYVMPADGGTPRRLTFEGGDAWVVEWTRDSRAVVYASTAGQPFITATWLKRVAIDGDAPETLPYGPARTISFSDGGGVALGRFQEDPARWKRYRGGRAGVLWVDPDGDGDFRPLVDVAGNAAAPRWVGDRVFFLSDHDGVGNLYSCRADGSKLTAHTERTDFYVRHPSSDGRRVVYCVAGDLYVYDTKKGDERLVAAETMSPRTQVSRRFTKPDQNFESVALHPKDAAVLLTVRGRLFTMAAWDGPVVQVGEKQGVRYRMGQFMPDGERVLCLSDEGGEEAIEVMRVDGTTEPERYDDLAIGRPVEMTIDPTGRRVAIATHAYDVIVVDLLEKLVHSVETASFGRVEGLAWSPDGKWLAYGLPSRRSGTSLRLFHVPTAQVSQITDGWYPDHAPSFDPEGRYLYFLSRRDFDPVYDAQYFDLNFPQGVRPHLVTLRKDVRSPFVGTTDPPDKPQRREGDEPKPPKEIQIDLDGIGERIVPMPVPEGLYHRIIGTKDEVLFSSFPIEGSLNRPTSAALPQRPTGRLSGYKLAERRLYTIVRGISDFYVDGNGKRFAYRSANSLRVGNVGTSWESASGGGRSGGFGSPFGRQSGFVDLSRVKVSVEPRAEWRQMYREAWRLMRDHFWQDDMSGQDWEAIFRQYEPLLERIGSRAELSDLFWETQGSLGTSHAYEMGGDYRQAPAWRPGTLACDTRWNESKGGYEIVHLVRGEPGDIGRRSPLLAPGLGLAEGDSILKVGTTPLRRDLPLGAQLANRAGEEIVLTVQSKADRSPRQITVQTLTDERPARYREWILQKRAHVHERSQGRLGYVHIPDMGAAGYAEFHRDFRIESDRAGLVVDVRYNRGGHVSQLLLEKLARRPIAYMKPRHGSPWSYPHDAVLGPRVAITNEFAGSDGDVFSHAFKLMRLGKLVGKRTWGGVIGIWPRHALVDGTVTTQPEFSFWFSDVGWRVENYGTDPDVVVEYRPQDYAAGTDPQLDRAIDIALGELENEPVSLPSF
jgi:tricorn protease